MDETLKLESERLTRSWMQHESEWLRDYLVQSVEDPRINLPSIFSRHFLLRAVFGDRFQNLMEQEYRFSACMNWLFRLARSEISGTSEFESVLHALKKGADNAEGIIIPTFIGSTFLSLSGPVSNWTIPNYIESFLTGTHLESGKLSFHQPSFDTFQNLWSKALSLDSQHNSENPALNAQPLKAFEPACGSANDYRFLKSYGVAQFLDYTGMDLCPKNIENALSLFPTTRFELGNVFEISATDNAYDFCFVHDLFEHLSTEGLSAAVREICRVTRLGICVGFFNMDEIPEHIARPVEEYHWNTLSLPRVKELFDSYGFDAQMVHVATFLRQHVGCAETHNPNAYTFFLSRTGGEENGMPR